MRRTPAEGEDRIAITKHPYGKQLHDKQLNDEQLHDEQLHDKQLHGNKVDDKQLYGKLRRRIMVMGRIERVLELLMAAVNWSAHLLRAHLTASSS